VRAPILLMRRRRFSVRRRMSRVLRRTRKGPTPHRILAREQEIFAKAHPGHRTPERNASGERPARAPVVDKAVARGRKGDPLLQRRLLRHRKGTATCKAPRSAAPRIRASRNLAGAPRRFAQVGRCESARYLHTIVDTPSGLLRALTSDRISESEFAEFERLLATTADPQERDEAVVHLLRVVRLEPEQAVSLAKSHVVRERLGLQLELKRYVRAQQYASSRAAQQLHLASRWGVAFDLLVACFMSFP